MHSLPDMETKLDFSPDTSGPIGVGPDSSSPAAPVAGFLPAGTQSTNWDVAPMQPSAPAIQHRSKAPPLMPATEVSHALAGSIKQSAVGNVTQPIDHTILLQARGTTAEPENTTRSQNISNLSGRIFEFPSSYRVT